MRLWALPLLIWPGVVAAAPVCQDVSAREGWQQAIFPVGIVEDVQVTGAWTVADGVHEPVGAPGHLGAVAEVLSQSGTRRVDPGAAHGTLLYRVEANGVSRQGTWAAFKTALDSTGPFRMNGGTLLFRINETDPGLSDNAGTLTVCLMYTE
ncbi:hypothetical protein [Sagittula stellata]|uniref:hypothetical protein n=1 Tax=Sagittula stellata TaxID=52603 RepID=UPI0012F47D0A|nr:hypothetical protein [Sagittula stellata]